MTFDEIILLITACAPSITAIIGCISSFLKNKKIINDVKAQFEEVRQEVINTKNYDELKSQLHAALSDNASLKKKINQLIIAIERIERNEE